MNRFKQKVIAEEATGMKESGEIIFYNDAGNTVTAIQALKLLLKGKTVEVPSAGAGSYVNIFYGLGFNKVKAYETVSSAGDWSFAIEDETGWRLVYQENRYPRHGFTYSFDEHIWGIATFKDLVDEVMIIYGG